MRSPAKSRLRGSSTAKVSRAELPCPLCNGNVGFHLHCQVCCAPLDLHTAKRVCAGECRKVFSSERRKARSVRCRITRVDDPSKTFVRWIPRKLLQPSDIAMSGTSEART